MMDRLRRLDTGLLLALLLPLLAVLPLLTHAGLPNTADGPAHLMRQVELNQAWAEGNFYPRWGTDLALGHGMPIFSYAPPLLYQATQLLHLTGLPLDSAMKGVMALGFLLYSGAMFLFARRIYGPYPALVAAAMVVYAPYRLREAYIQGNYGQFLGLAFYPLIFWAFHGLLTADRPRYRIFAPLALAGLLFSHNISFMLFGPMFAAYLLFLLGGQIAAGKSALALVGRTVAAGLLGLGLAAIFWLPAFGERHDIKLEGITRGFFDFRENFITVPQFLAAPLPLDLSAINPEFPLSLGLPQIIGAALGLLALLFLLGRWAARRAPANPTLPHTLFFAVFLAMYAFLAVPWSQPVWERVPLLELTEFPWRMLGPAIFCAAVLSAAAFAAIERRLPPRWVPLALGAAVLLIIALNAYYLYPSQFIPWGTPTPADAFAYEVTSGAIGTTSTGEFLPRWAQQHPRPDALQADYAAGRPPHLIDPATLPSGAVVTRLEHRAEADSLQIDTPQPFTATLRRLYWPGWQVYLDGQPAPFAITPATGLIQTTIPAGTHTLTLRLESTPLRTAGLWLSGLSLLALAIFALARRQTPSTPPPGAVPGKVVLVATLLLLALYLLSRPLAPFFTQHSDPDRPLPADQLKQVDFTDQLRLVGADNWPQTVALTPGQPADLSVTLYWRALQKLDTNYAVFLHLDDPTGQTRATVDEVSPENIPTRNWPPGLYLRNPLHLKIPGDLPPLRYTLTAGWYNPATGERLPLAAGSGNSVEVGSVWLIPTAAPQAGPPLATFGPDISLHRAALNGDTLTLLWRTARPIEQNTTIFVHVTDAAGNLLSQADGAPLDGLYPLPHWLPGQFIEDKRTLALDDRAAAVTIGLYWPDTGERLPAFDAAGPPLPEQSFRLAVQP